MHTINLILLLCYKNAEQQNKEQEDSLTIDTGGSFLVGYLWTKVTVRAMLQWNRWGNPKSITGSVTYSLIEISV